MTPEQIKLVQTNFGMIFPIKMKLAQSFYDHLFEIAPEVRPLFPENMQHQREKLADTLAFVVRNLNNSEELILSVSGLARRHRGYEAKPEHFDPVGIALIHALDIHTPGGLSDDARSAWATAYGMIVDAMLPKMLDGAA
ncbi:globin domain-containing protein [Aliishimia ponticola]|nr:globin domain-containing protein [Aliishimia ponticola]